MLKPCIVKAEAMGDTQVRGHGQATDALPAATSPASDNTPMADPLQPAQPVDTQASYFDPSQTY